MEVDMSRTSVFAGIASAGMILIASVQLLGQECDTCPMTSDPHVANTASPGPEAKPPASETGLSRIESFSFRFGPGDTGRTVEITQDRSGRIRVTLVEEKDGRKNPTTYEADSPKAFREKYSALAREYGIGEAGWIPRLVHELLSEQPGCYLPDELFGTWPGDVQDRLNRLQDRFRREINDLFGFRDGSHTDVGQGRERTESETPAPSTPAHPDAAPPRLLGVRVSEPSPVLRDQLHLGREGVVVDEVVSGSLAERAGLHLHDIILSVDGKAVHDPRELRHTVRDEETRDGIKTLDIRVMRGGVRQEVMIDLASK
jgi:hypothetical protein